MRGAAEEQLAERQRLTVTSTDQRPLAMRSVHFPFDCDAFLQMIPKLNLEIDIVWYVLYIKKKKEAVTPKNYYSGKILDVKFACCKKQPPKSLGRLTL